MNAPIKEISIVVPVFNSEESLPELAKRISKTLKKMNVSYELIFVDDFSSDNSWGVLKKIQLEYEAISVIRLSKNYGQHNATFCGLQEASGNTFITLDDDLEQSPEYIPELYACFVDQGVDLLYGSPIKRQKGMLRNFMSYFWNFLLKASKKGVINASSFRVLKKNLVKCLIQHKEPFVYIDSIALWYTKNIEVKEIAYKKRKHGKSNYSIFNLLGLNNDLGMHYDIHILKFMLYFGATIFFGAMLLICYFLLKKFYGQPVPGYTSLIIVSLFSAGSVLWGMGYLGIYIGKMFRILNKEPQYQVSEKIDSHMVK